jgi:lipoprotein-anchoring transpeptidase ErfK/SrfK
MTPRHDQRRPGHRRGAATFAVVVIAILAGVLSAVGSAQAAPRVASSQALTLLLTPHTVRSAPRASAQRTGAVAATRPLTGVHTVLPVLATATAADGSRWQQVRIPGRAKHHSGWISADGTRAGSTGWAIVVRLATRRVTVYERGHVARRFRAIVGKRSTPTPRGRFFVEETLVLSRWAPGAPYALATSARSSVLQEFDGGPGQIALHGMGGLSGRPGSAVSHGCVRLSDAAITWMARRIGAGVPVQVVA